MATAVLSPVAQRRSPVALWHLLSMDAPTVAVVWMLFFTRLHRLPLPVAAPAALGLAVWIIYATDRLLDGYSGADADLQERHRFHRHFRSRFIAALAVALVLLIGFVAALPAPLRTAWLLLGIPLCAYAFVVHRLRTAAMSKELPVGLIFASACALPCVTAHSVHPLRVLVEAFIFACLCWLNGLAISAWEADRSRTPPSMTATGSRHLSALLLLSALCAIAVCLCGLYTISAAALLSIAGLYVLQCKPQESLLLQRSLADITLLTPLLLWPFLAQGAAR